PGGEHRRQVASAGANPVWGHDSKELFYETADGAIMSIPVTTGETPVFGKPQEVMRNRAGRISLYPHPYAVSADGQHFLVNELVDVPDRITVVLHWTSLG